MRNITEDEIRSVFGEKTFSRGKSYFEDGYVEKRAKKGENLTGTVLGSAPHPYRVDIELNDDIHSTCTCPVGVLCKHGVALLLQWVHNKDSFVDCDRFLVSMKEKSKKELMKIIQVLLESDLSLVWTVAGPKEITHKRVNPQAIAQRLQYIGRGSLDYDDVYEVAEELDKVKEIGDNNAKKGHVADAGEVYLLLIERGLELFEAGADDSSGRLGDTIMWCVEDFNTIAETFTEEQKRDLLYRILKIVEVDDYGLETEKMLYALATKGSIPLIEKELLGMISPGSYCRSEILDLVSGLYNGLGMQKEALRVMKEAGFECTTDYVRIARAFLNQGSPEKAFHYVQEGLRCGPGGNTTLSKLYFRLLNQLIKKGDETVTINEMMTTALQLLSSFDSKEYSIIKKVFKKMGYHDQLIETITEKCSENVVLDMLLYEKEYDKAVEYALSCFTLHPVTLMDMAGVAKTGNEKAAMEFVRKAVKNGLSSADPSACELIEFFVAESDEKELKEVIKSIRNMFIARLFVTALLKRNQDYATSLLKTFVTKIGKEEVKSYVMRLENTYAKEICHIWVSAYLNQSYVRYDNVIDVLKMIKGIYSEKEWKTYISMLMEENSHKKVLREKIKKMGW